MSRIKNGGTHVGRMPVWVLDCEPREVQLEAIRRSFYGIQYKTRHDEEGRERELRGGPANGWGHFMQMRLGKTPTLLNEFELTRRLYDYKRLIILAPNSYKPTWGTEWEKFRMKPPIHVLESRKVGATENFVRKVPEGAIVLNYEALRSDDNFKALMAFAGPDTMIAADESILIKGHDSIITKQAIMLAKECGIRRAMSGKPVSQGPHDLWAQMRFIGQLSGYNYFAFRGHFCKMGGFQGKAIKGVKNEDELADLIQSNGFKARRSDWMNHFAVDYSAMKIPMGPEQQRMYDEMDAEFVAWLDDQQEEYVKADQIITKLMKLQQISSGFIIDEDGKARDIVDPKDNPKARVVIDMLENEIEGKVILAVHYKRSVDILTEALAKYNPAFIRGGQKDVNEQKARFNGDPSCRVMIGQIQAMKYGHTLVGTKQDPCTTTIMYENTFSLDDRSQVEERNQGADQQGPTSVIDFFASKNDLRPIKALQDKEDVAAMILKFDRSGGILPHA